VNGRNYMQDMKDADSQCDITRNEKQELCASFRMRMYSSSLIGDPEKYVYVQSPKSIRCSSLFSTSKVFRGRCGHVSFPIPAKDIRAKSRKSKIICKLKTIELVNERKSMVMNILLITGGFDFQKYLQACR